MNAVSTLGFVRIEIVEKFGRAGRVGDALKQLKALRHQLRREKKPMIKGKPG